MRGEDLFRGPQCGCQCWCVLKSSRVDRFRNSTELDGENGKARREKGNAWRRAKRFLMIPVHVVCAL
jgi:hypothetical protein